MTRPAAWMFDDRVADAFYPFALTRPCGEILYGAHTPRARLELACGVQVAGHVTRPWLASFVEPGAPPVVGLADIPPAAPRILWCSRAVPEAAELPATRANLWVEGALAGVVLDAGEATPDAAWIAEPAPLPGSPDIELPGEWLEAPWDLVGRGPTRLARDLEAFVAGAADATPPGVHRLGEAPLVLGEGASVEPGVLVDTRLAPVVLGPRVEVRAGARLEGPVFAGPDSRLLGGSISALAAGPRSYLRGEVEETIVFGYSNKAHDGFIGHAVLGRWVNLGAMTTNSDLKNNYGPVRVGPPDRVVDTGLTKLGCLVGDHVKTGIGVLLNTGTVIGAGSNIWGAELPPKWVEPFSWGQGAKLDEHRRDAFLSTAATVLGRRDIPAVDEAVAFLGDVWDRARGESA
ncbi:MAG: putative sugar nucleotidyl transferase [Gemmatimonadota bacterium]|nr:putative sugar nucleotidyl transferase [Gemmatimonadota bacterium]